MPGNRAWPRAEDGWRRPSKARRRRARRGRRRPGPARAGARAPAPSPQSPASHSGERPSACTVALSGRGEPLKHIVCTQTNIVRPNITTTWLTSTEVRE